MTFLKGIICAIVFATAFYGAAPAQQANSLIDIEDAWVRMSKDSGELASAYFTILNKGEEKDFLVGVTSTASERALLQELRIKNFRAQYNSITKLEVGAKARRRLSPDGYQVTLQGLTRPLRIGESISLTLTFERAGRIEVSAKVSNQMLGNR